MGHHLVGFFKTIQLLGYPHSRKPPKKYISGWWLTYPEKSWTKSQLGWWHSIPNWMESHNPAMFQTTNQGAFIALDWSKGCMKMGRLMNICSPSNGLVSMISCNWVKTMNTSRKKVQYSLEYPSSSWDIEHSQLLWWSMCSNMVYIYMRRRQNQLFTPGARMLVIVFLRGALSLYSVLCKSTLNNTNMQRNCCSSTMSKTASSKISKIRGSLLFCKDILVACLVFWKNANKNKWAYPSSGVPFSTKGSR